MNIEIGKYTIKSDTFSLWITEKVEYETKDGQIKEREDRIAGFCTSFPALLRSFCLDRIMTSDAQSVKELLETLRDTYEDMCNMSRKVESDFSKFEKFVKGETLK